jgi:hypothetical protein
MDASKVEEGANSDTENPIDDTEADAAKTIKKFLVEHMSYMETMSLQDRFRGLGP